MERHKQKIVEDGTAGSSLPERFLETMRKSRRKALRMHGGHSEMIARHRMNLKILDQAAPNNIGIVWAPCNHLRSHEDYLAAIIAGAVVSPGHNAAVTQSLQRGRYGVVLIVCGRSPPSNICATAESKMIH